MAKLITLKHLLELLEDMSNDVKQLMNIATPIENRTFIQKYQPIEIFLPQFRQQAVGDNVVNCIHKILDHREGNKLRTLVVLQYERDEPTKQKGKFNTNRVEISLDISTYISKKDRDTWANLASLQFALEKAVKLLSSYETMMTKFQS